MYVHEQLNIVTVVPLEVLFHYEIIYEMGPLMLESRLKSLSLVWRPLNRLVGGGGVTVST